MPQTAVATLTVYPYPKGVDNTQRRERIQGTCSVGASSLTTTISITAWSITSNVVTFTATNALDGDEKIVVSGFTGANSFLNGSYTLTSATGSTMLAALTHANGSASATGTATVNRYSGPIAITSFQVASDVITYQAANDLAGTETVTISGFSGGNTYANGTITLTSATATTLVASISHIDAGPITAAATAVLVPEYVTSGLPLVWSGTGLLDGNFTPNGPFIGNWGPTQTQPVYATFFSLGGLASEPGYSYLFDTTNNTLRIFSGATELANAANITADNIGFLAEFIRGSF
jgi:hypothetical protein